MRNRKRRNKTGQERELHEHFRKLVEVCKCSLDGHCKCFTIPETLAPTFEAAGYFRHNPNPQVAPSMLTPQGR